MSEENKIEEMNQEHFTTVMNLINGAYQRAFTLTENVMRTWYLYLKYYNDRDLWDVAYEWCIKNPNPPTIMDFKNLLDNREIVKKIKESNIVDEGYQE